jgi:hypothetical protein
MSKLNNRRVFPDANKQPRQNANMRKTDALARQAAYDKLSLKEKLERMPPEPHAKKQRARLQALLLKQNETKETPKPKATEKQSKKGN